MRSLLFLLIAGSLCAQTLDVQKALRDRYLDPVKRLFVTGDYERAANAAATILSDGDANPDYHRVLIQALMILGQKEPALAAAKVAVTEHPADLHLLMLRYDALVHFGERGALEAALRALNEAARQKPARERTTLDLVALGRAALVVGADPQKVIEQYLNPAKKKEPKALEPWLALADLAMEKGDYQRASKELQAGLKEVGEHPDLRFGLARAFAPSDRAASMTHLSRALEMNPRHLPSLLLQAEHQISAEAYNDAEMQLASVLEVDRSLPTAWALRSVIAILGNNDPFSANNHRTQALDRWQQNPEVDHLIGKALSRAYRFAEGAQYQREALALDASYQRAKLQLSHDLMRLGETEAAWKLAAEIRQADPYNTQAHNLGLLEREMSGYHTHNEDGFVLILPKKDWEVYGQRAMTILKEARQVLAAKYGLNLSLMKPTRVEFFPSQQDFAIRTFGSLGGQGLLGVCFGTVVTMNSPGSLAAGRNNWESTLWHEYCHVVTLSVTHNRMPRWLSEGISVYEEARRDPAWGMPMTADWRARILDEKEPPVPMSRLSTAFMNPKDGDALMFAYFQSAMAVKHLIEVHGQEKFQTLLAELASGTRINAALEKTFARTEDLDAQFQKALVKAANDYAPKADFSTPSREDLRGSSPQALAAFLEKYPNNITALRRLFAAQMEAKAWQEAMKTADRIHALEPNATGADSALWLKAKALSFLDRTEEELELMRQVAEKNADAASVFNRLIEVETAEQDWEGLHRYASRAFALNPFLTGPSKALALACESLGRTEEAISHYERLLKLDASNPALIRYKLARLYQSTDAALAKRHVLDALAEAPRFKAALKLLQELP